MLPGDIVRLSGEGSKLLNHESIRTSNSKGKAFRGLDVKLFSRFFHYAIEFIVRLLKRFQLLIIDHRCSKISSLFSNPITEMLAECRAMSAHSVWSLISPSTGHFKVWSQNYLQYFFF